MSNVPILRAIVLIFLVTISKGQQIQSNSWVDQQEQNFNKLFAKFDQLETKVRDQEFQLKTASLEIASLKKQVQRLESLLHLQNIKDKSTNVLLEKEPVPAVSYSPRTCHEARESGLPEYKNSGMYWIDPDGVGFGNSSIYVYCDMKTGATLVGHDSEFTTSIPVCNSAGCYKKSITYPNATSAQIQMLAELSTECKQSIRINCVSMPLENNAWWVDKNGKQQIFWSGSTEDVHTCDCGIKANCVQEKITCNCDSNVAVQLSDNGVIGLKNILPVKELAFGGASHTGGSHTLGKLECSGKTSSSPQIAVSCRDLWLAGHILNGLYPIKKDKKIEFVYCDFSSGIYVDDERIGYVDVKSEPVHFTVQKKTNTTEGAITFETALDNEGTHMNMSTGIFKAPVPGTYVFDFSGLDYIGGNEVAVDLYKNDEVIGSFFGSNHGALTIPSVLNLSKDDKIKLTVANEGGTLFGDTVKQLTHFTGFLLEEDVFEA